MNGNFIYIGVAVTVFVVLSILTIIEDIKNNQTYETGDNLGLAFIVAVAWPLIVSMVLVFYIGVAPFLVAGHFIDKYATRKRLNQPTYPNSTYGHYRYEDFEYEYEDEEGEGSDDDNFRWYHQAPPSLN